MSTNRFAGPCTACGRIVPAGDGNLTKDPTGWVVAHADPAACATAAALPVRPPVTEVGMYLLDGVFYKVQVNPRSKRLFAKRLIVLKGGGKTTVKFRYQPVMGMLSADDKLTAEQAREFGVLYGTCVNCGIALSDARSTVAGYGKVCAGKHGWPYPTKAEAEAILAGALQVAAP